MGRKRKSLYTVREATAIAFKSMPETFMCINMVEMVRSLTARPSCTDGTITRRLRDLRADNPEAYGYECINQDKSIYRKRKLKKLQQV
ncbi:hypothetical protein [Sunxiuqinia indica]|uniref:hypothetical protein n=1 Tax=Sunxiuqinia indica TaxID=2692584 RepID=UPI0013568792|nr:hypothetical protein [Sunxiuqinia indica]